MAAIGMAAILAGNRWLPVLDDTGDEITDLRRISASEPLHELGDRIVVDSIPVHDQNGRLPDFAGHQAPF